VLAKSLTWSPATQGEESRRVVVAVKVAEGRTRIRVEERYEIRGFRRLFPVAGGLSGAVFGAIAASVLGIADATLPALLIPFMAMGIGGGVFGSIKFEANTRRPQLEALARRLEDLARGSVPDRPSLLP
jgi:hypothetical protein